MKSADKDATGFEAVSSGWAGWGSIARKLLALFYGIVLLYLIASTVHWPLVWDATVFHYINFLTAHGMAPYRDIFDMNMPGTYMLDNLQMHLFGRGDLAWRMYDYFLLFTITLAMMVITWPVDWLAGFIAAAWFAVLHVQSGPVNAGQREELIAALLLVGYAALYKGVRAKRPALLFGFGLVVGLAISVKPTFVPLFCAMLLLALYVTYRQGSRVLAYAVPALAGVCLPAIAAWAYLQYYHATADFFDLSRRLTAYYAGLMRMPIAWLVSQMVPHKILPMLVGGLILIAANTRDRWNVRENWERWGLWLGAAAGGLSFIAQRKGYDYHRYPTEVFVLLAVSLECARVLHTRERARRWVTAVAGATVLYATLIGMPEAVYALPRGPRDDALFMQQLEVDLDHLGGTAALQHQVQCLDMVDGCLGALYHLNLVQNTGFTGDTLFFVKDNPPPVAYYRKIFLEDMRDHPPKVLVVSDEWFNWERGYSKIEHWPAFAQYLEQNYTLLLSRKFPRTAYRIYLLKGTTPPGGNSQAR